ncbi:rod shape-determining protein RodA [Lachnospiraceae bacterium ZAX-1]
MFKQYHLKNYRFRLIVYVTALSILGVAVVGSARESLQTKQVIGLLLGLFVMAVTSCIDYSFILKFSWLIYLFTIGLLGLIRFFGDKAGGATRWIQLGSFRFQPSELAKILIILFFAYFFSKQQEQLNTFKIILISGILIFIPWFMILQQPDLSTSIVVALVFISLLFLAGLSYKIIVGAFAVSIPAIIIFITFVLQPDQKILNDYQYRRIMSFLQPENPAYAEDIYQQQNSIMAIGSGQMWGKGLNNNTVFSVKNGNFIPEPQTDFIFSVAGEELGFVGAAIILLLLLCIAIECIMIGRKAKDLAGKLICGGIASLISFQAFINICVVTGLMPNTGLPLPFVSNGLTSMVSLFIGIGLVLNVGLQPKKYGNGVWDDNRKNNYSIVSPS